MTLNQLKVWVNATRPFSLTGSAIPVTLGAVFAIGKAPFHPFYFILSLLGIVALQASSNLLNDYYDYKNKVDTADSYGSSGVIVNGLLKPEAVLLGGRILLTAGTLAGLFFTVTRGLFILEIGLIGVLAAYFYTAKPVQLKYRGLGVPVIFLIFGPLMVIGSYFVQTQTASPEALLVSIPVGLLTTAIVHANDIRDRYYDNRAGIKTLSIAVGGANACRIYYALLLIPYISVVIMALFNIIPYWSLLCMITLPASIKNIKKLHENSSQSSVLAAFDKETAELQGKFGIIFVLSILIPGILR